MNDIGVPKINRVLVIQLGDIGDVVLTTPTIRAVKDAFPEARISVLVRKPFGSLLQADPNLHEVVEAAKSHGLSLRILRDHIAFARRLRRARYDLVIDLRTGDRGAIYSFLTRAKTRIARQTENPFWHDLLFTKLIADPPYSQLPIHPGADQSLRIVRALGIDTTDPSPKLYVAPHDRDHAVGLLAMCELAPTDRWVTINPCSRWKYKEWGYENWGKVIDLLWRDHRLAAVLIGSPEEAEAAKAIVSGRNDHAFALAGKTTLGELSALISMSTLHLGVDSAAPHIAMAVGTPSLTLFGPGNWKSWTVVDELHRVVTADMPCVPCNRMGCDDSRKSRCLDELGAGKVYAEANAILSVLDLNRADSNSAVEN
ncbi:MAG: glycosyltransferase family 9 protein [Sideroxyarcus sp.]|nr:glycosyltransferase family 9 protein [Sideroxyarcus sp.]